MSRAGGRVPAAVLLALFVVLGTGDRAVAAAPVSGPTAAATTAARAARTAPSPAAFVLPVGGPVRAAGAGVVTHAGPVAGRGTVTVEHADGLRTTYEPVTTTVRAGQVVVAGQSIGALEAGHLSCAPASCLHWGARLPDGSYLDPMGLINGLDVRLLPWTQARG